MQGKCLGWPAWCTAVALVLASTSGCGSDSNPDDEGGAGTGGAPGDRGPPLPSPSGTCPDFTAGTQTFVVNGVDRKVQIWIDPARASAADGPLVVYWYSTGGQPSQAAAALGMAGIEHITAAGGIVAAPSHVNPGVFPWIQGDGSDYLLMDEIVGCAEQKVGIDAKHIHTLGMSAGALFTGQISFARSSYIASVATYSGGGVADNQDPSNKFAAMIFHGGPGDMVVINFQTAGQDYYNALKTDGHFAAICNHGRGHTIPTDAVANVVQFFDDHPFGTDPSPYQAGLPSGFPSYCAL